MAFFPLKITFWTGENTASADKKSMDFRASFKQILREKMGENQTFSSENEASILSTDPAHMAFLLGKIRKTGSLSPRGNYPAPKVRPQRKPHDFSPAQRLSYEFFKSWVHDLPEGFTTTELKKAFRQAAKALHPDLGGTPQLFIELKSHYKTLSLITGLK